MGIWNESDSNSRLYIGDLPSETTEQNFKHFLVNEGIRGTFSLTMKKGYAFMQCSNQATADLVIDRIHGLTFNGSTIKVEPAISTFIGANTKHGHCIVSLAPIEKNGDEAIMVSLEEIDKILGMWGGSFLSLEKQSSNSFLVTLADVKTASDLIGGCHGISVDGFKVTAKFAPEPYKTEGARNNIANVTEEISYEHDVAEVTKMSEFPNKCRGSPRNLIQDDIGCYAQSRRVYRGWTSESNPQYLWRMLIPSSLVGALIGRNGTTIRGITELTETRINIHTGNSRNYDVEKMASIFGSPENISFACRKILDVLVNDLSQSSGELTLRLIAYNSLIGRVIGRGGVNITTVMQETQTRIHISSIPEIPKNLLKRMECDRVITIRGSLRGMCLAEAKISDKLRNSFESDMQKFSPQRNLY